MQTTQSTRPPHPTKQTKKQTSNSPAVQQHPIQSRIAQHPKYASPNSPVQRLAPNHLDRAYHLCLENYPARIELPSDSKRRVQNIAHPRIIKSTRDKLPPKSPPPVSHPPANLPISHLAPLQAARPPPAHTLHSARHSNTPAPVPMIHCPENSPQKEKTKDGLRASSAPTDEDPRRHDLSVAMDAIGTRIGNPGGRNWYFTLEGLRNEVIVGFLDQRSGCRYRSLFIFYFFLSSLKSSEPCMMEPGGKSLRRI